MELTATSTRIRAQIVDDYPVYRRAISQLLGADELVDVVAESATSEAVDDAERSRPDLVVLDMHWRDPSAAAVVQRIRRALPQTQLLVLSTVDDQEQMCDVVRAGARGLLSRRHDHQALREAIRVVASGEPYLEAELVQAVAKGAGDRQLASRERRPLSDREAHVLRALARGSNMRDIATALGCSQSTVSNDVHRIYSKLGVANRANALAVAAQDGWLRPEDLRHRAGP